MNIRSSIALVTCLGLSLLGVSCGGAGGASKDGLTLTVANGSATLVANPSSVDLGTVNLSSVGAVASQDVTVAVAATGNATVTSITVDPPFSIGNMSLPVTVSATAPLTFTVSANLQTAGQFSSTIKVNGSSGVLLSIPVTIIVVDPSLSVSILSVAPTSLNFGNSTVGVATPQLSLVITNSGGADLQLQTLTVSGPFVLSGFASGTTVAAHQSTTVQLSFVPTSAGVANGSLTIVGNASNSPLVVPLVGSGTAPTQGLAPGISVVPGALSFGPVTVNSAGAAGLTVSNIGTSNLTISDVSVNPSGNFSVTGVSGTTVLAPGQTLTLQVVFTPDSVSTFSANLSITSDDPNTPVLQIPLTGSGIAAVVTPGSLSATPLLVDFGSWTTNTTSDPMTVVLTNTGSVSVTVSQISISPPGAFILGGVQLPLGIAAGQTASIPLTFRPTADGVYNATMTITSTASPSTNTVSLTGTAVAATPAVGVISFTPASINFGSVNVGSSSTAQSITVSNIGNANYTLQSSAISPAGPFAITSAPTLPVVIAPGQSQTITVVFSPVSSGTFNSAVALTTDIGNAQIGINGQGAPPIVDPTEPVLPTTLLDTSIPAVVQGSHTLLVGTAGASGPNGPYTYQSLQAAIDASVPGDQILIQAGYTTTLLNGQSILLRNKVNPNNLWITISTENLPGTSGVSPLLPPPGTRVGPSDAPAMAKIVKMAGTDVAIDVAPAASHYRLVGLEITIDPGQTLYYTMLRFGTASSAQSTLSVVPSYLYVDRCYLHGHPNLDIQRAIGMNSAYSAVIDSYISDIHSNGSDSQTIFGSNGPGPYKIVNNYLEASGENILWGGADPYIPGLQPADIEVRRNHFIKPLTWLNPLLSPPGNLSGSLTTNSASTLASATQFFYQVVAIAPYASSSAVYSDPTNEVSVTTGSSQPAVNLSWGRTSYSASAYEVYRTTVLPTSNRANSFTVFHLLPSQVNCSTSSVCSFTDTNSGITRTSANLPAGARWSVKNLYETKNSARSWIDGNIFENNWPQSQNGFAIGLTVRDQSGTCTWCTTTDVTFSNNIIRNTNNGMTLTGYDNNFTSQGTNRLKVVNNLFYNIQFVGNFPGSGAGRVFQPLKSAGTTYPNDAPKNLKLLHNTVLIGSVPFPFLIYTSGSMPDLTFKDNLALGSVAGNGGEGNPTLANTFANVVFTHNALIARPASAYSNYSGNFFPANTTAVGFLDLTSCLNNTDFHGCELSSSSTLKNAATDGTDVGADFSAIDAAQVRP